MNVKSIRLLPAEGFRGGILKNKAKLIILAAVLAVAMSIPFIAYAYYASSIPDSMAVFEGESLGDLGLVTCEPKAAPVSAAITQGPVNYEAKLLGVIPVKTVSVSVLKKTSLVPVGKAFGVKLFTQGVMVVGMSSITTAEGDKNPAYEAGVRTRDIIISAGGKEVNTIDELSEVITRSGGQPVTLECQRNGAKFTASITAVKDAGDGQYKAGLWVRDSTAGIGTITFLQPDTGLFAGLGHGICDVDTGDIMPLMTGTVVAAEIHEVRKGERGLPGELRGVFLDDSVFGKLMGNSETGIFGKVESDTSQFTGEALQPATYTEIEEGKAEILANVEGNLVERFEIEITKVYKNSGYTTKNMTIRVTDSRLLAKTGGIVQGMSGCPIIQNGKLVGAVTHVLVNDPTKGYGIFIENMLEELRRCVK